MKHQTYIIERDLMKRFYSSRKYHEERNHREGKIIKIPKKKFFTLHRPISITSIQSSPPKFILSLLNSSLYHVA